MEEDLTLNLIFGVGVGVGVDVDAAFKPSWASSSRACLVGVDLDPRLSLSFNFDPTAPLPAGVDPDSTPTTPFFFPRLLPDVDMWLGPATLL